MYVDAIFMYVYKKNVRMHLNTRAFTSIFLRLLSENSDVIRYNIYSVIRKHYLMVPDFREFLRLPPDHLVLLVLQDRWVPKVLADPVVRRPH